MKDTNGQWYIINVHNWGVKHLKQERCIPKSKEWVSYKVMAKINGWIQSSSIKLNLCYILSKAVLRWLLDFSINTTRSRISENSMNWDFYIDIFRYFMNVLLWRYSVCSLGHCKIQTAEQFTITAIPKIAGFHALQWQSCDGILKPILGLKQWCLGWEEGELWFLFSTLF